MPEIPPDVITVILSLLPAKPLARFRCVSKSWCAEIDSPRFIKRHYDRLVKTRSDISIILNDRISGSIHSVDFENLDKAIVLKNPFEKSAVLGSCNGLVMLKSLKSDSALALYNPTTRKHKVIPVCPPGFGLYGFGAKPIVGCYGLGFDALNDDYKIISILEFVDSENGNWVGSDTKIYSLNSNEWKPMKGFPYKLPWTKELSVHVGGALHTLVDRNRVSDWPDVILVTDLVKEDYRFMELPGFVENGVDRMSLDVLGAGDFLCLQVVYEGFRTDLWVMKEYGVMSSWSRLLSVAPPVLPALTPLDTLLYSKDRNKVLFSWGEYKLCWYDLKGKMFNDIPIQGLPDEDFYVYVCVGSLVPPNGFGKSKKNEPKNVIKGDKAKKKRDDFLSKGFKLRL